MKKNLMYLLTLICGAITANAQNTDTMYQSEVTTKIALLQLDGTAALWFTDADTGRPLADAHVAIDGGGTIVTDIDGLAVFSIPGDGDHNFVFQKNGYVKLTDTFEVVFGSILFNKFSVPSAPPVKQIKIVLDWSASPADLDLHLVKNGAYHISYHDMKKAEDGSAWLDRDDTDGYGPETITISILDNNASYNLYIHDYTNKNNATSTKLSASHATVRIYINNELNKKFVIPENRRGIAWNVCNIINEVIVSVNMVE
ncbi:hypothetical protein FACS1894109_19340 [Spirochaetia bacterium]|nr:hypothetical protein FACS1894109_19340 [Spirochaetia bacterium]